MAASYVPMRFAIGTTEAESHGATCFAGVALATQVESLRNSAEAVKQPGFAKATPWSPCHSPLPQASCVGPWPAAEQAGEGELTSRKNCSKFNSSTAL